MTDHRPCPFCGGPPEITPSEDCEGWFDVGCSVVWCVAYHLYTTDFTEGAFRTWDGKSAMKYEEDDNG